MSAPLWAKLTAALLPIAISPVIFALGSAGQSAFTIGLMLGAFFGITLALPFPKNRGEA